LAAQNLSAMYEELFNVCGLKKDVTAKKDISEIHLVENAFQSRNVKIFHDLQNVQILMKSMIVVATIKFVG
jgi:hypothetical protein